MNIYYKSPTTNWILYSLIIDFSVLIISKYTSTYTFVTFFESSMELQSTKSAHVKIQISKCVMSVLICKLQNNWES